MISRALCLFSTFAFVVLGACSSGSSGVVGGLPDGGSQANVEEPDAEPEVDAGRARDGGKKPSSGEDGPLAIKSLTPTVSTLTGGEPLQSESNSVTFIAIVTDKSGLDTIAGGQLMDDSGATYAAFGAGANKGTYVATLDWPQMNSIKATDFDDKGGTRTFVAKFFDNDGNEATAEVDVKLACRKGNKLTHACGGTCADVSNDPQHCGSCSTSCSAGSACIAGACGVGFTPDPASPTYVQTACLAPTALASGTTCDALCAMAKQGDCTRIIVYTSATCAGTGTDGTCTEDLAQVAAPFRCRCVKA